LYSYQVDEISETIADAETAIVCTAVGASALPFTAPAIASGIEKRYRAGNGPLNVLLCENLYNAAEVLRAAVSALLPEANRDRIIAETGFVQAVVSRMVPLQTTEDRITDPLGVRVEAYKRLPVDGDAWVGPAQPSSIVGLEAVSPFEAYVERKLFTHNCAHAVMGYLGYAAGHEFGYEALDDPRIEPLLKAVLEETGRALISKHGFNAQDHAAHVADLLHRFNNRELGDTCKRLARDPIRKLAPGDRIVGAARCCESQCVSPKALSTAIAAALSYYDGDDPSAIELQKIISERGLEAALKQVCDIDPNEPLYAQIEAAVESSPRANSYS
jgi:mannitol-1-phosphate 5-dehydrogenase